MAIPHAKPGEVIDIGIARAEAIRPATATLVKTDELEVVRLVVAAGKEIKAHQVPGQITLQCWQGRVLLRARNAQRELVAGQLVYLGGSDEHALRAVEDSLLLLTILLKPKRFEESQR